MFKDEQLFECEKNCAVFVAIDKLSQSCNIASVNAITKPPTSATSGGGGGGGGGSKNSKTSVDHQQQQTFYKIGDRVMAFDNEDGTVHGTVKWVGGSSSGKIAGIQTVSPV